jgi:hypothetical protein
MATMTNRYHSTQVSARTYEILWPDLRKGLIGAGDRWLHYLEDLTFDLRPVPTEAHVRLRAFLSQAGIYPGSKYWHDPIALQERVYWLQEIVFRPGRLGLLGEEEAQSEEGGSD